MGRARPTTFIRICLNKGYIHIHNIYIYILYFWLCIYIYIRGVPGMGYPKMDGLFHGKPYLSMDDLGVPLL